MKKLMKYLNLLIYSFLLIMMIFLLLISCASKKEKLQEKEKIELKINTISGKKVSSETNSENIASAKKEVEYETSNVSYQGNKGDSIVIIETNLNTGVTTKKTYKGSGNYTETKGKGNVFENIKSSSKIQASEIQEQENKTNLDVNIETSKSKKLVEKKSFLNWWLLLLLVIIAIFWYLNKKYSWLFKLYSQIKVIISLIFK